MKRRAMIGAAVTAALAAGSRLALAQAATPAVAPAAARPNIIFILADDLGYGDVGCYGQTKIKTPNIDQLAREGLKFTNAYAGAPVCAPSRCALLTGMHTGHARIRGNVKLELTDADTTVAQTLKQAGYDTMMVGKWGLGTAHNSGSPLARGFNYFYGFIDQTGAHNSFPTFQYENDEKVMLRNVVPNEGIYGQGVATVKKDFVNDIYDEKIIDYLKKVPKDRPFFLYDATTAPHANDEAKDNEVPDLGEYADKDWTIGNKQYAALVSRLDGYVGHIHDVLKERGLDQNTLIIFTSDNGPQAEGGNDPAFFDGAGPLRGIKREVYEGGIREPMIAVWPGHTPAGATTDQKFVFWDLLPTAAELAGVKPPANVDGISIAATLEGKPQIQQHDYLYWEFYERGFDQAVRAGDWKAVRHGLGKPIELYDLKTDIAEAHDVSGAHADIVQQMQNDMADAHVDSPYFSTTPTTRVSRRAAN